MIDVPALGAGLFSSLSSSSFPALLLLLLPSARPSVRRVSSVVRRSPTSFHLLTSETVQSLREVRWTDVEIVRRPSAYRNEMRHFQIKEKTLPCLVQTGESFSLI